MTFSRRLFLQRGAIAGAALGGGLLPGFARRALAQERKGKVFVFLFLRGALDGLSVVVPNGDGRLAQLRPQLEATFSRLDNGPRLLETLYANVGPALLGGIQWIFLISAGLMIGLSILNLLLKDERLRHGPPPPAAEA